MLLKILNCHFHPSVLGGRDLCFDWCTDLIRLFMPKLAFLNFCNEVFLNSFYQNVYYCSQNGYC